MSNNTYSNGEIQQIIMEHKLFKRALKTICSENTNSAHNMKKLAESTLERAYHLDRVAR